MSSDELWAAIGTTDRPEALSVLCDDLVVQAHDARLRLSVFLVENSTAEASRQANLCTVARLRERGVGVTLAAMPTPGCGIASTRLRLRELVRSASDRSRPRFVWALDDDVRLLHLVWTGERLETRALHNHVQFLQELAGVAPDLDVLIGEVSGDPPIPAVATLTSALADVEASLTSMFCREPSSRWPIDPASVERVRELDAYYDFSVERASPTWSTPVSWLPRGPEPTVARACRELLEEVALVPLGAAVTRPILTDQGRFRKLAHSTRRGANAVFFDLNAYLEHDYPSATVWGIETRRSDMIGTRCLARRRPGRVRSSGFSVLHRRPRASRWPTADETLRALLADTFGALLAREVEAGDPEAGEPRAFLLARVARIEAAVHALSGTIERLERLLMHPPTWVTTTLDLEPLRAVLDWSKGCLPGVAEGRLARDVVETLTSDEVERVLRARAAELRAGATR